MEAWQWGRADLRLADSAVVQRQTRVVRLGAARSAMRTCVGLQRPRHAGSGVAAGPQAVEARRILRLTAHRHFRVRRDARLACARKLFLARQRRT